MSTEPTRARSRSRHWLLASLVVAAGCALAWLLLVSASDPAAAAEVAPRQATGNYGFTPPTPPTVPAYYAMPAPAYGYGTPASWYVDGYGRPVGAPVAPSAYGYGMPSYSSAPTPYSAAYAAPSVPFTGSAVGSAAPLPYFVGVPATGAPSQTPAVGPLWVQGPGNYLEPILAPRPGARTRGVAISEWESYRTDVAGRNIIATTDDSNLWVERFGKLNGNTGDTDASGLNVTDATDSVIRGTVSADQAPWQTDPPEDDDEDSDTGDEEEDDEAEEPAEPKDAASPRDGPATSVSRPTATESAQHAPYTATVTPARSIRAPPAATAMYHAFAEGDEGYDFPYTSWLQQVSGDSATAIHTDEGTTLASGQDAVVIGGDGYDDDDNRVVGENIVVTRDDGNVALGGVGDVNSQIGDSEQGAVIMDVHRVFIQGGAAY